MVKKANRPCTKRRYKDKLEAKIALASTQRSKSSMRAETRVYWHRQCRAYHLTSKEARVYVASRR